VNSSETTPDGSALVQNWIDEDIISDAVGEPNEVLVIKVFVLERELGIFGASVHGFGQVSLDMGSEVIVRSLVFRVIL
tara:strand:- start:38 stop:271 length:234 start_codon:yes stop_codon:yes gene_type:complete